MHPRMTQLSVVFSVLTSLALSGSTVQADAYGRIDRHAVRIQAKARLLTKETVHYRHTPNYRALVLETNKLYRLATHVHDVTHFEGNLVHLEQDLRQLDRCFHRLEELFDLTEHDSVQGYGHVHGNTRHVKRLLNDVEECIHAMQREVMALNPGCVFGTAYRPSYSPSHRGYGHGYGHGHGHTVRPRTGSGFGFTIGGGSSRIHIRF